MKLIQQVTANEAEGLAAGDVRSVDDRSAAILIDRGDAKPYEPGEGEGERVETIDDIVDPEVARNRRTMTATIVGGPSTGGPAAAPSSEPATSDPATPATGDGDTDPSSTSTTEPGQQSTGTAGTGGTPTGKAGKAGKGSELAPPGANPAGGVSGGGGGTT
jgi:hypothetical protein